MSSHATEKPRRSRAEQRETTRRALLDSTLESLTEIGYAATTARGIAERAGVSQGAMQHHYPTKAALAAAAFERTIQQIADQTLDAVGPPTGSERETTAILLDTLWAVHNLPITRTAIELANIARDDAELAPIAANILNHVTELILTVTRQRLPHTSAKPGFRDFMLLCNAAMRGTVMAAVPGADNAILDWPQLREQLLKMLDALE